jgi:hypothetical protein
MSLTNTLKNNYKNPQTISYEEPNSPYKQVNNNMYNK